MPAGLIRPRRTTAAACFWLVQFFFGLPSLVQAMILLTTSRAEGALFMIALFLAWIGATLAVIAGTLVHGSAEVSFPAAFATYAFAGPSPATEPEPQATVSNSVTGPNVPKDYHGTLSGFPYRSIGNGKIEALTSKGNVTYDSWKDFWVMTQKYGRD